MTVKESQIRATTKYEKNNYFKTLVRFPKDKEDAIRGVLGTNSLNNFIVSAVLEKVDQMEKEKATKLDNEIELPECFRD